MYRLSVIIALMLAVAVQADELPPPRKLGNAGSTVPPPLFQPALEDGRQALRNLRNDVRQVQSAREALKAETEASTPIGDVPKPSKAEEISHLKKRLAEAVIKLEAAQKKKLAKATPAPTKPLTPAPLPLPPAHVESTKADNPPAKPFVGSAIDALALAPVLFQSGDYEGALAAYRLVKAESAGPADRVTVMYMTAVCLRKLGKDDEAGTLFREVANVKGEPVLVECAQWQLSAIRWKHDVETTLEEFRQRRKALEAKP